jgi:hypothetical protein
MRCVTARKLTGMLEVFYNMESDDKFGRCLITWKSTRNSALIR